MRKRLEQNDERLDDFRGFLEEFQGESDRAATVLGAAYLDAHLRQLITAFLVDDSTKVHSLLKGTLASFRNRIGASYCMGLISQDEHDDLHTIREIRNKFAHRLHGLSFSDDRIQRLCSKLLLPERGRILAESENALSARERFDFTVVPLCIQLRLRTLGEAQQHRRVVPTEYEFIGKLVASLSEGEESS